MNLPAAALIGQPVDRAEDLRFLTGRGKFVDDLKRDGMLHAVVLRSRVAHGRIRAIDAAAARARPGVRAVITAAEIGDVPVIPLRLANLPEFKPYFQPVIASDKVRYVGEPLAVVVADSQALAEDALDAIDGRHRAAAGGRGPTCGGSGRRRCCSSPDRQQSRDPLCGRLRRCRRGICQGALHASRDLSLPPPDRAAARDPRLDRRMERRQDQAHGLRRHQGAVLQPPDSGADARHCREPTSTCWSPMSAVASACAASSIRRIFSSRSRLVSPAGR